MNWLKPIRAIGDSRKLFLMYVAMCLGTVMAFVMAASFSEWAVYMGSIFGLYSSSNAAVHYARERYQSTHYKTDTDV